MGTVQIKCSITPGGGPCARGRACQSGPKIKNKIKKRQSHDLFDAVTLEAAGASLLLHLAGGAVAHPPAVGVAGGGRELHVLLVDPCGDTSGALSPGPAAPEPPGQGDPRGEGIPEGRVPRRPRPAELRPQPARHRRDEPGKNQIGFAAAEPLAPALQPLGPAEGKGRGKPRKLGCPAENENLLK